MFKKKVYVMEEGTLDKFFKKRKRDFVLLAANTGLVVGVCNSDPF